MDSRNSANRPRLSWRSSSRGQSARNVGSFKGGLEHARVILTKPSDRIRLPGYWIVWRSPWNRIAWISAVSGKSIRSS